MNYRTLKSHTSHRDTELTKENSIRMILCALCAFV